MFPQHPGPPALSLPHAGSLQESRPQSPVRRGWDHIQVPMLPDAGRMRAAEEHSHPAQGQVSQPGPVGGEDGAAATPRRETATETAEAAGETGPKTEAGKERAQEEQEDEAEGTEERKKARGTFHAINDQNNWLFIYIGLYVSVVI